MAKKKNDEQDLTEQEIFDLLNGEFTKEYGTNVFSTADFILDENAKIIPWSPSVDVILNKGIPEGAWVSINGPAKCGKTSSLLSFAANAQKPEYGNKTIYYFNIEGRLKEMNLRGTKGLDLSPQKFRLIQSTRQKILSTQENLSIAEKILKTHPECVLLFDSVSALADEKELIGQVGTETRGHNNKVITQFINNVSNVVRVNKCIVIGITHTIANTSGYGSPTVEKAANRWLYQADVRLKGKADRWLTGGETGKQIGLKINWTCQCSALGPPGMVATSYFRFGLGIDNLFELIQLGLETGLIQQNGAWYQIQDQKAQGEHNLYKTISENEDLHNWLKEQYENNRIG